MALEHGDVSEGGGKGIVSREEFQQLKETLEKLQQTEQPDTLLLKNKKVEDLDTLSTQQLLQQLVVEMKGKTDQEKYAGQYNYVAETDIDPYV